VEDDAYDEPRLDPDFDVPPSSTSSPSETSSASSDSSSSSKTANTSSKRPLFDPEQAFRDKMAEEMEQTREDLETQLEMLRAEEKAAREERLERLKKKEQAKQAAGPSGEQEAEEEDTDDEDDEQSDGKEDEEAKNIQDAMSGRADLKSDWHRPHNEASRPNTELSLNIDQMSAFFAQLVQTFHDIIADGWDNDSPQELRGANYKLNELYEYLDNFDHSMGAIEASLPHQEEDHGEYFMSALSGKDKASIELRELLKHCIDKLEDPEFGYAAQVKVLTQLRDKFFPIAGVEEAESGDDLDLEEELRRSHTEPKTN